MMDKLSDANIMSQTTIAVVSDTDCTSSINASNGTDHGLYGVFALFGNGITGRCRRKPRYTTRLGNIYLQKT